MPWLVVVGGQEHGSSYESGMKEAYDLLNMFRALLCPSSGTRDYTCGIAAYGV
jgi:hypothetical protein